MAALSAAKKFQHAAIIDDVAAVIKDGDGELVLSQVLPNVVHRIEFWRVGGKGKEVMLSGVTRPVAALYPAPSRARMACASLATSLPDFCQMKGKCSGSVGREGPRRPPDIPKI